MILFGIKRIYILQLETNVNACKRGITMTQSFMMVIVDKQSYKVQDMH